MGTEREVMILKRSGNIGKLKINGEIFAQEKIDTTADGESTGDFLRSNEPLLGVMQNLTPFWDKDQWAWEGTFHDLKRIADALGIYDTKGNRITVDDTSLKNRFDPFFNQTILWKSRFIKDSSVTLTNDSPIDEFYMRVQKGRRDVKNPAKTQSSFEITSNLEIISPTIEKEKKSKTTEKNLIASAKLLEMSYEKQKKIASIIDPPGYSDSFNDPDALKILLYESCVNNTDMVPSQDGKTYQVFFLELEEKPNDILDVYSAIYNAIRTNVIRRSVATGYKLQNIPIADGEIKTDDQLLQYYLDDRNIVEYDRLLNILEENAAL